MLEEDTYAALLALGGREMQQRPAVGIPDLGRVALLQHLAHGVDITGCHRSLDLQLLLQVRVPSEVMVQHPVTLRSHSCVPGHKKTSVSKAKNTNKKPAHNRHADRDRKEGQALKNS